MSRVEVSPTATAHDVSKWKEALGARRDRARAALNTYTPLKFQERFHSCTARECMCLKGNRSGGSIAGFVEDARAVLGQDPYNKYPKEGVLVCIGFGQSHIGTVIYRHLFQPGLWKIIKDKKTHKWRPFRPWEPDRNRMGMYGDWGREDEAQPSPPLIPHKYLTEEPAWTDKKKREFDIAHIETATTKWDIRTYNSNGDPNHMQGFKANLIHFDEDIANEGFYYEAVARTNDSRGLLRWTAMKHLENEVMSLWEERAEDQAEDPNPRTVVITANPDDNPYYSEEDKQNDKKLWMAAGEDIFMQRWHGQASTARIRVYPTFATDVHSALPDFLFGTEADEHAASKVQRELAKCYHYDSAGNLVGEPPHEWCRYASNDPGHGVFAVLMFAVPPPEFGDQVVIYDELYLRQCDASTWGHHFKMKSQDVTWQDIIIDIHGARLRELGTGKLPLHQYEAQLRKHNIRSVASGHSFTAGLDDPDAREVIMREWLGIRADGMPKLMVIPERCPEFCREMIRFYKKRQKIGGTLVVQDTGDRRRNTHAIEAAEYGVAHGLEYKKPPSRVSKDSFYERVMSRRRERAARRRANRGGGGRGIVLGARGA